MSARPFKFDTLVTWNPNMRPVKAEDFAARVLMSDPRVTIVLIDGKPRQFATKALMAV